MSEKLKTPLKIGAAAAFLLICIFLPRAFLPHSGSGSVEITSPSEFSQRAELFTKFWEWNSKDNKHDLGYSEVNEADLAECESLRDALLSNLDIDKEMSVFSVPGTKTLYTLSDGAGNGMNLIDYYYKWDGDWSSWLTITMDIETRDVYRIYFSTNCIKNFDRYYDLDLGITEITTFGNEVNYSAEPQLAGVIAEIFGQCTQLKLMDKQVLDTGEMEDRVYTFVGSDHQKYTYSIKGNTYFHPEVGAILIDYKLLCKVDA